MVAYWFVIIPPWWVLLLMIVLFVAGVLWNEIDKHFGITKSMENKEKREFMEQLPFLCGIVVAMGIGVLAIAYILISVIRSN